MVMMVQGVDADNENNGTIVVMIVIMIVMSIAVMVGRLQGTNSLQPLIHVMKCNQSSLAYPSQNHSFSSFPLNRRAL